MTKTRIRQAILCAIAAGLVLIVPNARGAQAAAIVLLAILFVAAAQYVGRVK